MIGWIQKQNCVGLTRDSISPHAMLMAKPDLLDWKYLSEGWILQKNKGADGP